MGREAEINEERRKQAILDAAATAKIFDRFGRPMVLGAEFEFHDVLPQIWTLVDATPNLDRRAPNGQWLLTLQSQIIVTAQAHTKTPKLTLVQMPQAPPQPPADGPVDPAGTDAPAGGQSSIVLTDMDKTARETLASAEPASSEAVTAPPPETPPPALTLVPPTIPTKAEEIL